MITSSIKVSLDTRRSKKDGTYPLILRLTHNRKTTSIKTGIFLKKEHWDAEKLEVKKSYKGTTNITRLNNEIQKKKAEALDSILKLSDTKKIAPSSVTDIKQRIDPEFSNRYFYVYADILVADLLKTERVGTARSYQLVLNVLKTFNKGRPFKKNKGGNPKTTKFKEPKHADLKFVEINYNFLQQFENYHLSGGNELNGLAVYMRTIRAIFNKAIKAKEVDKELYPFGEYKIKTKPTRKRALDNNYIAKIIDLNFPQDHPGFKARNFFVASYMMCGMNFADMAYLKKSDLINGRIHYRRQKTSKLYDIKITDSLAAIFSHYSQQAPDSLYIFPIIKREGALLQQKDIQWARKRFNDNLKSIAEICNIEQKLTSYVSRPLSLRKQCFIMYL